jgi:hypothetical protein
MDVRLDTFEADRAVGGSQVHKQVHGVVFAVDLHDLLGFEVVAMAEKAFRASSRVAAVSALRR